jgi:hypothetical protein
VATNRWESVKCSIYGVSLLFHKVTNQITGKIRLAYSVVRVGILKGEGGRKRQFGKRTGILRKRKR